MNELTYPISHILEYVEIKGNSSEYNLKTKYDNSSINYLFSFKERYDAVIKISSQFNLNLKSSDG
jgi:hypothetical protein